MIAGFSMCFFLSHQRLWVKVDMEEGGSRVVLAGATTKNQSVLADMLGNIKTALE
jgi:hypothetical protein